MCHPFRFSAPVLLANLLTTTCLVAQESPPALELTELRNQIEYDLLHDRTGAMAPALEHIWVRNGGLNLSRNPHDGAAKVLASRLAQMIAFDADSGTITWPVQGFGYSFGEIDPAIAWLPFDRYLTVHEFDAPQMDEFKKNFVATYSHAPIIPYDPLIPPAGLSKPASKLLEATGFYGNNLFVWSPENSFDLAVKCHQVGMLSDAVVLLSHSLAVQESARAYYLRGVMEMILGRPEAAKISGRGYLAMRGTPGRDTPSWIYERVNGPAVIQFRSLVAEIPRQQ